MKDHKLINVLGALKATGLLVTEIIPYIDRLYKVDTILLTEIKDLCVTCKDYYMGDLPVANEIMKILVARVKQLYQLIQQVHEMVKKDSGETGKLLHYRDQLNKCLSNLKKTSAVFKFERKQAFAFMGKDDVIKNIPVIDEGIQEEIIENAGENEAERVQRMEFENQEEDYNLNRIWDYLPDEIEYDETYP